MGNSQILTTGYRRRHVEGCPECLRSRDRIRDCQRQAGSVRPRGQL